MQGIKCLVCLALTMIVFTSTAHAIQVITPVEGESVFVNIAKGELNLIQFPFNGIRAYTSSQKLDLKIQGRQVWVTMTDQNEGKPQEVFLSTPYGTYLMMMVPKSIPAETIVMKIDKGTSEDAAEWEREHDYTKRLKELVKALYLGVPPAGYAIRTQKKDASMWEGIEQTLTTTMIGSGLVGETHELINHGNAVVRVLENEFYREGVLAVSLSNTELRPAVKETVYIVRRNSPLTKTGTIEAVAEPAGSSVVKSATESKEKQQNLDKGRDIYRHSIETGD